MKFELFPFQMNAVRRLRKFLVVAQANYKLMDVPQAISFTAPTGAGKTIMLAALVEQVYRGDGNYPAQPDAIFVWLSDSPELNQQSCDKFYFNADGINPLLRNNYSTINSLNDNFNLKKLSLTRQV